MSSVAGWYDKGPTIIIVTSVMAAVALLLVVARLVSRRISVQGFAIDDYLVVISIVCTPPLTSLPLLHILDDPRPNGMEIAN